MASKPLSFSLLSYCQKDRPNRTLPSFSHYLNKVFLFRPAVGRLSDAREQLQVFPQGFLLALFYGFVFRLSSF